MSSKSTHRIERLSAGPIGDTERPSRSGLVSRRRDSSTARSLPPRAGRLPSTPERVLPPESPFRVLGVPLQGALAPSHCAWRRLSSARSARSTSESGEAVGDARRRGGLRVQRARAYTSPSSIGRPTTHPQRGEVFFIVVIHDSARERHRRRLGSVCAASGSSSARRVDVAQESARQGAAPQRARADSRPRAGARASPPPSLSRRHTACLSVSRAQMAAGRAKQNSRSADAAMAASGDDDDDDEGEEEQMDDDEDEYEHRDDEFDATRACSRRRGRRRGCEDHYRKKRWTEKEAQIRENMKREKEVALRLNDKTAGGLRSTGDGGPRNIFSVRGGRRAPSRPPLSLFCLSPPPPFRSNIARALRHLPSPPPARAERGLEQGAHVGPARDHAEAAHRGAARLPPTRSTTTSTTGKSTCSASTRARRSPRTSARSSGNTATRTSSSRSTSRSISTRSSRRSSRSCARASAAS